MVDQFTHMSKHWRVTRRIGRASWGAGLLACQLMASAQAEHNLPGLQAAQRPAIAGAASDSNTVITDAVITACHPSPNAPDAPDAPDKPAPNLRALYAQAPRCWPAPNLSPGIALHELAPLPPAEPDDTPLRRAQRELGRRLFFDKQLSRDSSVACASCHDPQHGWADGRKVSLGIEGRAGRRNAPSVATAAGVLHAFWDGRASTLETQALGPVQSRIEMDMTLDALRDRIAASIDYPRAFEEAYGPAQPAVAKAPSLPATDTVTLDRIADALARFERSLRPARTRFDDFLAGDVQALNDQELRGLDLFRTRARCLNCHNGPWMSDNGFHNLGLHLFGRRGEDLGRFDASGDARHSGQFKTPSLRGVAGTAPYMHHGLIPTLKEVLSMYKVGMPKGTAPKGRLDDPMAPVRSPLLQRLDLGNDELDALEAFLNVL